MTALEQIAGIAHDPGGTPAGVVVLSHGAGGSRESPMLIGICEEWAARGWLAIRYNLPYRRLRPKGPPPGSAASDRAGIAEAVEVARTLTGGPVVAGGHSYGGRLTSEVVAGGERVAALTLFSYPLHPPGKPGRLRTGRSAQPGRLRTEHFTSISVPAVFTHGSSDPFGSIAELEVAAALIAAPTEIVEVPGAGHDLGSKVPSKVTDVSVASVDAALRHIGHC